jgi:hypothetical protein
MKKLIILSLFSLFFLAACQKKEKSVPQTVDIKKDSTIKQDTVTYPGIQDDATMNIRMVKDSLIWDDCQLEFNHTNKLNTPGSQLGGGPYSDPGGGWNPTIDIFTLSYDSVNLKLHGVPYIHGMSVGLNVDEAESGNYFLGVWEFYRIPSYIHVWLRDSYLKDSLDLRKGNYHFYLDRNNLATYGKRRFSISLR